jgi:hypothetical protein
VSERALQRSEQRFGALIDALAVVASLLLLAMMLVICGDVFLRNVAVPGLPAGIAWSNEISELMLYLLTMLAAPWLLREGRHIRVDIVLRVLAAEAGVCLRVDRRRARPRLLPVDGLVRRRGAGAQLRVGGAVDQDAGDARVVVHGAVAGLLRPARDRVRVPHATPRRRRREAARRCGERGMTERSA